MKFRFLAPHFFASIAFVVSSSHDRLSCVDFVPERHHRDSWRLGVGVGGWIRGER